jgi:micrococcal nuclease
VIVSPVGTDRYGRMVAEVFVAMGGGAEKLLNDELVRAGMAYHYRQYSQGCPNGPDSLDAAEAEARRKRLGVWERDDQKPWEYRKAQRAT